MTNVLDLCWMEKEESSYNSEHKFTNKYVSFNREMMGILIL